MSVSPILRKQAFRLGLRPQILAVIGIYVLQIGFFIMAFLEARAAGDWTVNLRSSSTRLLMAGAAVAISVAVVALAASYRFCRLNRRAGFWVPVIASIFVMAISMSFAEIVLRLLAKPHPLGVRMGKVILRPFDWDLVVRANLELVKEQRASSPFLVPDPDLGWSVGAGRIGNNGIYKSSAEGLRSATVGENLRDQALAHRVALFGDSFTFSNEVPFEESLGYHLRNELNGSASILNFGVSGYGLDQAFLRFKRDGLPWSPRVAVLSFIEPDLLRMANVYAFLKLDWKAPLSKPRFVLNRGELALKNKPTLTSDQIFAHSSIQELPYLDLDVEFLALKWQSHALRRSYTFRYFASRFPPISRKRAERREEVLGLGLKVIDAFLDTAHAHRITPLVAYLPTRNDLKSPGSRIAKVRILQALRERGVGIEDLTRCVADQIPIAALFHAGGHYTNAGNIAAAKCFKLIVTEALHSSEQPKGPHEARRRQRAH